MRAYICREAGGNNFERAAYTFSIGPYVIGIVFKPRVPYSRARASFDTDNELTPLKIITPGETT